MYVCTGFSHLFACQRDARGRCDHHVLSCRRRVRLRGRSYGVLQACSPGATSFAIRASSTRSSWDFSGSLLDSDTFPHPQYLPTMACARSAGGGNVAQSTPLLESHWNIVLVWVFLGGSASIGDVGDLIRDCLVVKPNLRRALPLAPRYVGPGHRGPSDLLRRRPS